MHRGTIVAEKGNYRIIECEVCGFKHVDPIPTEAELDEFYKNKYFDLIAKGGRAPEIRRLMGGGEEARSERNWLRKTLYTDLHNTLSHLGLEKPQVICDVGCGTGDFLKYMQEEGWKCVGIEPSTDGASQSVHPNLTIFNNPLDTFIRSYPQYSHSFDVISLLNVLEHVSSPQIIIEQVKNLLKTESGIIIVRVPNDFTVFQQYAKDKLVKDPWWIALPDHINYFSTESLQRFLKSAGFEILYTTSDFPMEFFLLMGEDYVGNPEFGAACHKKRVSFDLSLSGDVRRKFYHSLAEQGFGRNSIVFARCIPR